MTKIINTIIWMVGLFTIWQLGIHVIYTMMEDHYQMSIALFNSTAALIMNTLALTWTGGLFLAVVISIIAKIVKR